MDKAMLNEEEYLAKKVLLGARIQGVHFAIAYNWSNEALAAVLRRDRDILEHELAAAKQRYQDWLNACEVSDPFDGTVTIEVKGGITKALGGPKK